MTRPTSIPLTSLADAASLGVDIALQERTLSSASVGDPSMSALPEPGTIGPPISPP